MSNIIVFCIMILSPFILQYSLFFTERKRRKFIKQTPKLKRRLINVKRLELLENNIPHFTLLYRGYYYFALLTICFASAAIGYDDSYVTVEANPFLLFCLISTVLFCIFNCILLTVKRRFTKGSIFKSFLAENSDNVLYLLTNKQYIFRFRLNCISLFISMLNLIIFFLLQ